MMFPANFKQSPWDTAAFGMPAFEIVDFSMEALKMASLVPGHYTVRISPLASKQLLHEFGFYYCDTLTEPHCTSEGFIASATDNISTSREIDLQPLLDICNGAFFYGRFHRDFNIPKNLADKRYNNWLTDLHCAGKVYGLLLKDDLAGFIAVDSNKLVLHAVAKRFRGKGLAKYLWTPVCKMLFDQGYERIVSSVSAANLAAVNLYSALGFQFQTSYDLYHRLTI